MAKSIDMSSNVKMTNKQKVLVVMAALFLLAALGFLYISTVQVKQKADKGEPYVTTIAPNSPGKEGPKGPKGDSPTPEEISQAVEDYCKRTYICVGKSPSQELVLAAVFQYCADGKCKGDKGADATPVSMAQIYEQVSSYCANDNCRGPVGATGANGVSGSNGTNGTNGEPPLSWSFTSQGVEYQCDREDPFDPVTPKYRCESKPEVQP